MGVLVMGPRAQWLIATWGCAYGSSGGSACRARVAPRLRIRIAAPQINIPSKASIHPFSTGTAVGRRRGATVSVSDALALFALGSRIPAGAVTVAMFVTLPLEAFTSAVTVIS